MSPSSPPTAATVLLLLNYSVGQEQDAVGGGFNVEESFVGEMSQMVMFDYALSPEEVAELATPQTGSCAAVYGQLLSWTDVLIGERHSDVIIVNQSHCLGQHSMINSKQQEAQLLLRDRATRSLPKIAEIL